MKEYKLKINGGYDFVVIAPQTLSLLISKIHDSSETELCVSVKELFFCYKANICEKCGAYISTVNEKVEYCIDNCGSNDYFIRCILSIDNSRSTWFGMENYN